MDKERRGLGLLIACALFFLCALMPWLTVLGLGKSPDIKVEDVAVINGIITASAVIYAFTLTGIARYRRRAGLALDSLLALSTMLMLYTGGFYFFHYVKYGYATLAALTWATTTLFWNFSMWFSVVTVKAFGKEIVQKRNKP